MSRRCWTCNNEHDPDEACPQHPMARAERAASGGKNSYLFRNQPSFEAKFGGMCTAGGDRIEAGESICSDGNGGYQHVNCDYAWGDSE